MFFKQLATKESSRPYFFGCAGHAIAAAVDRVAGDEDWFIKQAALANVRIAHAIDTLFVGATGRPDLAGREREMAGRLFDSLDTKLVNLPPELEIFPGHQAVNELTSKVPARPANMDQIVASNIAA